MTILPGAFMPRRSSFSPRNRRQLREDLQRQPKLEPLGSLEELWDIMHAQIKKEPQIFLVDVHVRLHQFGPPYFPASLIVFASRMLEAPRLTLIYRFYIYYMASGKTLLGQSWTTTSIRTSALYFRGSHESTPEGTLLACTMRSISSDPQHWTEHVKIVDIWRRLEGIKNYVQESVNDAS